MGHMYFLTAKANSWYQSKKKHDTCNVNILRLLIIKFNNTFDAKENKKILHRKWKL